MKTCQSCEKLKAEIALRERATTKLLAHYHEGHEVFIKLIRGESVKMAMGDGKIKLMKLAEVSP